MRGSTKRINYKVYMMVMVMVMMMGEKNKVAHSFSRALILNNNNKNNNKRRATKWKRNIPSKSEETRENFFFTGFRLVY